MVSVLRFIDSQKHLLSSCFTCSPKTVSFPVLWELVWFSLLRCYNSPQTPGWLCFSSNCVVEGPRTPSLSGGGCWGEVVTTVSCAVAAQPELQAQSPPPAFWPPESPTQVCSPCCSCGSGTPFGSPSKPALPTMEGHPCSLPCLLYFRSGIASLFSSA